jgi:hypothetical protein
MNDVERARYYELMGYLRDNPPRLGVPDPVRYAKYLEAEELEKGATLRRMKEQQQSSRLANVERRVQELEHRGSHDNRPPGSRQGEED